MLLNTRFGEYILLRKIATGGMAEVHLALKRGPGPFDKLVALKSILQHRSSDTNFVRMFENEARIAARFQHPNLVNVYDLQKIGGSLTMVLEYVPGVTVADLAKRVTGANGVFPHGVAIRLVVEACHGLHHAHSMTDLDGSDLGIVHRDVSPQNILVSYGGQVKVFDFGIARTSDNDSGGDLAGVLAGKYAYMSPEQCHGGNLDERSDVFSIGVVLYELTTNLRLFKRSNQIEVLRAITEESIKSPSEVVDGYPRALERIVMSALERSPENRPASALELADALRRYAGVAEQLTSVEELGAFTSKAFVAEQAELNGFLKEAVAKAALLPVEPESTPALQPQLPEEKDPDLASLAAESIKPKQASEDALPSFLTSAPPEMESALKKSRRINSVLAILLIMAVAGVVATASMGFRGNPEEVVSTEQALSISSEPPGATIFLNGQERAEATPATIPVEFQSESLVRLEATGYLPTEMTIPASDVAGVREVLIRMPNEASQAGRGVIYVVTDPRDAVVVVDGIERGTATPITVSDLAVGEEHTLLIQRENFHSRMIEFQLSSTAIREMQLDLIPVLDIGRISIDSEPSGAEVKIDGELAGVTPLERYPLIAERDFSVELQLVGYQPYQTVVRLEPNTEDSMIPVLSRRSRTNGSSSQRQESADDTAEADADTPEVDPYMLLPE